MLRAFRQADRNDKADSSRSSRFCECAKETRETFHLFKVSVQNMAAMISSELVNTLRETGAVVERIIKLGVQKKNPMHFYSSDD